MAKSTAKLKTISPQKRIILSVVSGMLFAFIIIVMLIVKNHQSVTPSTTQLADIPVTEAPVSETFRYQGKSDVDALTLLKEKAAVEQDRAGMVVSINGRKAETTKREFWSFYVNGEMAQVGSADYVTKDSDQLEWRIETY